VTYYHKIMDALEEAGRPLTSSEIVERVGGTRQRVNEVLQSIRERNDVAVDEAQVGQGPQRFYYRKKVTKAEM